ncbi:MAG: transglutaminase domain-containing protein [Planctomycetes bacterium]|nr:transglutaminase domain-containing protein [Planctomycetota bacterium]
MNLDRRLLGILQVLVLLDLLFVQLTGAVSAQWLVPLYAFTLATPWLARHQDRPLYIWAWNLAVLGLFGLLVQNVARTAITLLLEHGLVLAALCQVHLLNNLNRLRKPDLLFFNAILIAIVTCFFSQDLGYFAAFVVFVYVLVLAVRAWTWQQDGIRPAWPALVAEAARHGTGLLLLTAALFVLVPRDFAREGLVADPLRLAGAQILRPGFQEEIQLGRRGSTQLDERVVARLELLRGVAKDVPAHWRGASLVLHDPNGWRSERPGRARQRPALDPAWAGAGPGTFERPGEAAAWLRVHLQDPLAQRLFVPHAAVGVRILPPADPIGVAPLKDGNFLWSRGSGGPGPRQIQYEVAVARDAEPAAGVHEQELPAELAPYVQVAPVPWLPRARQLLREWRRGIGPDADQHVLVERLRQRLQATRAYLLPGAADAARNLEEFLFQQRGGHCEYFATALAVLLRLERVPCRVVTGYLAQEWDQGQHLLTLRARHAHAWVEVHDPTRGWTTVDPTPSQANAAAGDGNLWQRAAAGLESLWSTLTRFDRRAREAFVAAVLEWTGRAGAALLSHPMHVPALLGLLAGWLLLRRNARRRGIPPAILAWQSALRRAGLVQRPGETPREVLARAESGGVAAERVAALRTATQAHETARYAPVSP